MSNGGLLEKASDQPASTAVVADVVDAPPGKVGVMSGARDLILFGIVPLALFRWFEVYLDFIPFLMPIRDRDKQRINSVLGSTKKNLGICVDIAHGNSTRGKSICRGGRIQR